MTVLTNPYFIFSILLFLLIIALIVYAAVIAGRKDGPGAKAKGIGGNGFFKNNLIYVLRGVLSVLIIGFGVAVSATLGTIDRSAKSKPKSQIMRVLSGMPVLLTDIDMQLSGFGTVQPLEEILVSAELKGKIFKKRADLKSGVLVAKGELLCEIDVSDYKEKLLQTEAEIVRLTEEIGMKHQIIKDLEKELEAINNVFKLEKSYYERIKKLYDKRASNKTELEKAEKAVTNQMRTLIATRSAIAKTKIEIRSLEAMKQKAAAGVRQAKLDISRSKILSPFDGRVKTVHVENGEYVNVGSKLFEIANDSVLEIPVSLNALEASRVLGLGSLKNGAKHSDWFAMPKFKPVKINWVESRKLACWEGDVVRIQSFNADDGTVTLMVRPVRPLNSQQNSSGDRKLAVMPLVAGMYCKVVFSGRSVASAMEVPWSAIQNDNRIYIVDRQGMVREVETEVISSMDESVVISQGLKDGDSLVTQRMPNGIANGTKIKVVYPDGSSSVVAEDQAKPPGTPGSAAENRPVKNSAANNTAHRVG